MKHIKDINQFINEQLFPDANILAKALGFGDKSKESDASTSTTKGPLSTTRNDESACSNNDCWTHFGKEAFWNGTSKVNDKIVPKIVIDKTPTAFNIIYDGPQSGFLLKHAKGGKGDTIHQLMNVLTLELNEYLKTISAKPDIKRIKMEIGGNKLVVSVPLTKIKEGTHYEIARRGGLGHAGDYSGLEKYKNKEGYEEVIHKSGNLTEKFVTAIV
jgi:hypothetical protein